MRRLLGLFSLFFVSFIFSAAHGQTEPPLSVTLQDQSLVVKRNGSPIAVVSDILLNFESWDKIEQVQTASPNSSVFKLTYLNVVAAQEIEAYYDREVTLTVSRSEAGLHFVADGQWYQHVNIFLKDLNGHMFGVKQTLEPYNQKSPDLRGLIQDVNSIGEEERYRANYATAVSPLFFNTKGYLSFFDSFAEGRYQFAFNGRTELYHASKSLNWYIFDAPTLDTALPHYYDVIGKPKQVPVWSTGPIVWRDDHKKGAWDVSNDAQQFTALKMPITGMFIDRPYSDGAHDWSEMNFNAKFANPQQWVKSLNDDYNLRLMTWVAPMTFLEENFPGRFDGRKGYFDLTNPEAVSEFKRRLTERQYVYGIQGHKMDRADEGFPVEEKWHDGTAIHERRSKYIWLYGKTTHDILQDYWGPDHFNFARSAVHGSQQHLSAIWAGDVITAWEGLENNIANAIRASFQGFPNWGTDVGGYIGKTGRISEDLYLRWMQFGVWTGFFEIKIDAGGGRGEDRPPWVYPQQFQDLYRKALEERIRFMPYIHSLLNTAATTGTLMKPLAACYPSDANTYAIWDQYLFGSALLVAPIYNQNDNRTVYLPEGQWFDFYSGNAYEGATSYTVETQQDHVPVFALANKLVVTGNIYEGNDKVWRKKANTLTIQVFIDKANVMNDSFDFVDGNNTNTVHTLRGKHDTKQFELDLNGVPYDVEVILNIDGKNLTTSVPKGSSTPIVILL